VSGVPLADWPARLAAVCAETALFHRGIALEETASTQDASETRGARAGTFVTAWRQTAGRGRFGRHWSDTAEAGIATTFVVDQQPAERLALAAAVAAAEAAEFALRTGAARDAGAARGAGAERGTDAAGAVPSSDVVPPRSVGIKWPNDIVVGGRKLAGALIETSGGRALIGIGMNIAQQRFEGELEARATSLAMLGVRVDRVDVLCELVRALDRALAATDAGLAEQFAARDALRGTRALFATPFGPVEGEVVSVDPMRGLVVRTDSGEHFLPANSTSVAEWAGRAPSRPAQPDGLKQR